MKLSNIFYELRNLLFAIIGFIICSYIIYIRLLLKRESRELFVDVQLWQIIIYGDLFLIFAIYTLVYLYVLYRTKYPRTKPYKFKFMYKIHFYTHKISYYVSRTYQYSMLMFDRFIRITLIKKWLGQWKIFYNLLDPFIKLFSYQTGIQYKYTTMIFVIIPKILMLLLLVIDTFIFQRLYYFYMFMPVYLIPLIYAYILYIINSTAGPLCAKIGSQVEHKNRYSKEILDFIEYIRLKDSCLIPYRGSYYAYNKEKFAYMNSNFNICFAGEFYNDIYGYNFLFLFKKEEKRDEFLMRQHNLLQKYSNAVLVSTRLQRSQMLSMKKYYIDLILLVGYTLSWGYIFFNSLMIYIN